MNTDRKSRALGRGLSALMADVAIETPDTSDRPTPDRAVPIEQIAPNPDQPRRHFDEDALDDLAQSIREKGLLQPLIVRPRDAGSARYEIVAGERRWRAAQRAQLHEIPVIIRELDDREVLEVAIIENIQRADLNPVEEARGYRQLIDAFGHTQERLAGALGKSRSHIANALRLLSLPEAVQDMMVSGRLTAGHARTLITLDDPGAVAQQIAEKGLSVREAERLVKQMQGRADPAPKKPATPAKDSDTIALEQDLSAATGMTVEVAHDPASGGGRVLIRYADLDGLDRLCGLLSATGPDETI